MLHSSERTKAVDTLGLFFFPRNSICSPLCRSCIVPWGEEEFACKSKGQNILRSLCSRLVISFPREISVFIVTEETPWLTSIVLSWTSFDFAYSWCKHCVHDHSNRRTLWLNFHQNSYVHSDMFILYYWHRKSLKISLPDSIIELFDTNRGKLHGD